MFLRSSLTTLILLSSFTANAFTVHCPNADSINITRTNYPEPWRQYEYSAKIAIQDSMRKAQLHLFGQGEDVQLGEFLFSTWTDQTLLCWYAGETYDQVLTSQADWSDIKCAFQAHIEQHPSECMADAPSDCVLDCISTENSLIFK